MEESVERQDAPRTGGETATNEERERRRRRSLLVLLALLGLFLCLGCVSVYYWVTREPLSTLPPLRAFVPSSAPQYLFSIYGVAEPLGVATSPNGQIIYVMEGGGDRQIRAFDRSGKQMGSFSPPDSRPGTRNPVYGATDRQGNLYVTDRARMAVVVFSPEGKFVRSFTPEGLGATWQPLGIYFDSAGNLFVTEVTEGKHRVMAFNPQGKQILEFGKQGSGPGELNFPNAVVVDKAGRIFIANGNNGRIDVFNSAGELVSSFARGSGTGTVGLPRGMAVDDMNRLYVVDAVSHMVSVFDLGSDQFKLLFTFGREGMGDGEFSYPNGIAIDPTSRIYVTDRVNDRVQVWGY